LTNTQKQRKMLRLSGPTFINRKSARRQRANLAVEGPIVPSVGHYSRCGKKHDANEDRAISTTLAAALGSNDGQMVSFADMLSLQPEELMVEDVLITGIFDGHGGNGCVDFISKNISNRIAVALSSDKRKFGDLESAVIDGFKACEDEFATLGSEQNDNSGCCALVSLVHQNQVLIAWTGDCRAVLSDGKRIEQLTVDHRASELNEQKRILDNGGNVTNKRINGILSPSRGFGDLDIRCSTPEGVLISEPAVVTKSAIDERAIRKQSAFMILATDGIWDVIDNEPACDIVAKALKANGNNAEAAAMKLVEEASRLSWDDLTATVVTWNVVPWDTYSGIMRESVNSDEGEKF